MLHYKFELFTANLIEREKNEKWKTKQYGPVGSNNIEILV